MLRAPYDCGVTVCPAVSLRQRQRRHVAVRLRKLLHGSVRDCVRFTQNFRYCGAANVA